MGLAGMALALLGAGAALRLECKGSCADSALRGSWSAAVQAAGGHAAMCSCSPALAVV